MSISETGLPCCRTHMKFLRHDNKRPLRTHFPSGRVPLNRLLPEIGRSSSWKLPGAKPRMRCGRDRTAPAPLPPSRRGPRAGTRGSRAPTGSCPRRPAEPRGSPRTARRGRRRRSSSLWGSSLHPADQGHPSGEAADSPQEARSSEPAWHRRVRGSSLCSLF